MTQVPFLSIILWAAALAIGLIILSIATSISIVMIQSARAQLSKRGAVVKEDERT